MTTETKLTIRDLRREAAKHGATVTDDSAGRYWSINIDLPPGKLWSISGCHCILATTAKGPSGWKQDMIADALADMAEGTTECTDPDCDICHPE